VTNRSLSVGNTSDVNANVLQTNKDIIFHSPVFINKNLYIPDTGLASNFKPIFQDKVYVAGNINSTSLNDLDPELVDTGDLWISRYPHFTGIQNGILRIKNEISLSNLFSDTVIPTQKVDLVKSCNDYNRRKSDNGFCTSYRPELMIKNSGSNKYSFAMSRLSEFKAKIITPPVNTAAINYSSPPHKEKIQMQDVDDPSKKFHIFPTANPEKITINLMKNKKVELINGIGASAYSDVDLLSVDTAIRYTTNSADELFLNKPNISSLVPTPYPEVDEPCPVAIPNKFDNTSGLKFIEEIYGPPVVSTSKQATLTAAISAEASAKTIFDSKKSIYDALTSPTPAQTAAYNLEVSTYTNAKNNLIAAQEDFAIKVCTHVINTYNTISTPAQDNIYPKLILTISTKLTDYIPPKPLEQLIEMEAKLDPIINLNIFKSPNPLVFKMTAFDFCGSWTSLPPHHLIFDLSQPSNLIPFPSTSIWSHLNKDPFILDKNPWPTNITPFSEPDYINGTKNPVLTLSQACSSTDLPSSGFDVSYDADWTNEAFNSWNFNPVDKTNQFNPKTPDITKYNNIYNSSIPTVDNTFEIDSSVMNVFQSKGIVDRCIVKNSATIVKGFFICRFLIIEDRTTDLEMIGTFIVDKLEIRNLNFKKLSWKNIYHPLSRDKLVGSNQLKAVANCPIDKLKPTWINGGDEKCETASLMVKAWPFTWTTFDPLCLIFEGSATPLCKPENRAYNFNSVKIFEQYGN